MILENVREEIRLFNDAQAYIESTRCLMCEDAPCEKGCPANVPIKKFIRAIRFENPRRSINLIRSANVFAGVCGTICPVDSLCESRCTNNDLAYPIKISTLQRYVADKDFISQYRTIPRPEIKSDVKVAIIGGGPAGLAAAYYLLLNGIKATVFEKNEKPGGLLKYGIPAYRLSQELVEKEINFIVNETGVIVETNMSLGENFTIDDLKKDGFEYIIIATGLSGSYRMDIPGKDLEGVIPAIDFLREVATKKDVNIGEKVIVIGGGSVAMDSAITSLKLGADVTILYRRRIKDMPASKFEVEDALNKGIQINTKSLPVEYIGENGKLKKVKVIRMRSKDINNFTSKNLEPIEGSEYIVEADTVIEAIGQAPDEKIKEAFKNLENKNGFLIVNDKYETSEKNIYAVGDIVLGGGKTVVKAVAEAREVANIIAEKILS